MKIDSLQSVVDSVIEEGRKVLTTEFDAGIKGIRYPLGRPRAVDLQLFAKWQAGCANFLRMLGTAGDHWRDVLSPKKNSPGTSKRMLGTLEGISEALKSGLLITVEDIVRAETFDSLLAQADYLLSEGFFLAAGVLGRAVLEEHLKKWCELRSCVPTNSKATINDFKDCLYKAKQINLTEMKHIESLAAVGNDAAHNKPSLVKSEVQRLLRDIRGMLTRHQLSSN